MRQILIDAMELKNSLPKFILEEAEAYIDETEEVEAIPIDWLLKQLFEDDLLETHHVICCLWERWEKENEQVGSKN